MSRRVIPNLSALKAIDDYEAFMRKPAKLRNRITSRIDWALKVNAAPYGKKSEMMVKAAASLYVSLPTVSRFVRGFNRSGWTALVDDRGKNAKPQPDAFKNFVRQLHLQCQRATSGREAHRMLIERWQTWRSTGDDQWAIPGYDTPPPAGPKGYPHGFSEDSVLRLKPTGYALAVARQGAKSAALLLPSILKTRVGVKFGEIVFFDDQDYDVKVIARGLSQRALRPQGFNCLDYLSGCFMHHAIRLRWWDMEKQAYRTLTQEDFTWFVVSYLQKHGYRRDEHGTTLVFEHGTATGFDNRSLPTSGGFTSFDDALCAVSQGCIRVERSGLFNQPAFAGMLFRPQSSGNPRFKSPLESMFNLVRNRMAALPGAVGRNRDLKPAEQYGADLYAAQMLALGEKLDEKHRDLIILEMMSAGQFGDVARTIYQSINERTSHKLEGWEQLGHEEPQFRFTPDEDSRWLSPAEVMKLTENSRAALLANAEAPGHVRMRRLSPAAVAAKYASELTRLPDHFVPMLIPLQWARKATVKQDRTISLKDQKLGPEPFTYVCRFEEQGGSRIIDPGTTLLCYLNPCATERLVICREDGSYLGTLSQTVRAPWQDQETIMAQVRNVSELKADLDAEVRPILEPLMQRRAEMKRHNDRLKNGKPVLPEEIAAARSEAGHKGQRTAAANRLQEYGEAIDYDTIEAPAADAWQDPFASLPEENPFPQDL